MKILIGQRTKNPFLTGDVDAVLTVHNWASDAVSVVVRHGQGYDNQTVDFEYPSGIDVHATLVSNALRVADLTKSSKASVLLRLVEDWVRDWFDEPDGDAALFLRDSLQVSEGGVSGVRWNIRDVDASLISFDYNRGAVEVKVRVRIEPDLSDADVRMASELRRSLIRLAFTNSQVRAAILPLL